MSAQFTPVIDITDEHLFKQQRQEQIDLGKQYLCNAYPGHTVQERDEFLRHITDELALCSYRHQSRLMAQQQQFVHQPIHPQPLYPQYQQNGWVPQGPAFTGFNHSWGNPPFPPDYHTQIDPHQYGSY